MRLNNPWLGLVGALQKNVLARYASETITDFTNLSEKVTRTSCKTFTVIANWDETYHFLTV